MDGMGRGRGGEGRGGGSVGTSSSLVGEMEHPSCTTTWAMCDVTITC